MLNLLLFNGRKPMRKTGDLKLRSQLARKVFVFEQTNMYEILVTGPLCTSECADECLFE